MKNLTNFQKSTILLLNLSNWTGLLCRFNIFFNIDHILIRISETQIVWKFGLLTPACSVFSFVVIVMRTTPFMKQEISLYLSRIKKPSRNGRS